MLQSQREVIRAGGHRTWPHILIRPQPPWGEATGTGPAGSNLRTQPSPQGGVWMCFSQWGKALESHPLYPCWPQDPWTRPFIGPPDFPRLQPSFEQWSCPQPPLSGSSLTYVVITAFSLTSSPLAADLNSDFLGPSLRAHTTHTVRS